MLHTHQQYDFLTNIGPLNSIKRLALYNKEALGSSGIFGKLLEATDTADSLGLRIILYTGRSSATSKTTKGGKGGGRQVKPW